MNISLNRAILAGIAGTAVMTIVAVYVGPMMGMPPMNPAEMLAAQMGNSVAPWLLAQAVMMPMMGMGLFSGSMMMAGGSLMGHLIYGAVIGAIYGAPGALQDAKRLSVS